MLQAALIELPIEQAAQEKWRRGQAVHGLEFVGHPVVELDAELLDAMNYTKTAEEFGWPMGTIGAELRAMCERVRAIYHTIREVA